MPKYKVYCNNKEYLEAHTIQADSPEEAKEKYISKWEAGNVLVNESELGEWTIKEK